MKELQLAISLEKKEKGLGDHELKRVSGASRKAEGVLIRDEGKRRSQDLKFSNDLII